jgi:hypothetical protein
MPAPSPGADRIKPYTFCPSVRCLMLFAPEITLFTRIEDDPLDEAARVECESVLRSKSPGCREVRYLELERQLAEATDDPDRFSALLARLSEMHRTEFTWDDRLWTSVMPRLFDLWLDSFDPSLSLAVENALRIRCDIEPSSEGTRTPLMISPQRPALACEGIRSGIHEFICRYERRSNDQHELSRDEIRMLIRPAWTKTA